VDRREPMTRVQGCTAYAGVPELEAAPALVVPVPEVVPTAVVLLLPGAAAPVEEEVVVPMGAAALEDEALVEPEEAGGEPPPERQLPAPAGGAAIGNGAVCLTVPELSRTWRSRVLPGSFVGVHLKLVSVEFVTSDWIEPPAMLFPSRRSTKYGGVPSCHVMSVGRQAVTPDLRGASASSLLSSVAGDADVRGVNHEVGGRGERERDEGDEDCGLEHDGRGGGRRARRTTKGERETTAT
jgi:hypothetical protein